MFKLFTIISLLALLGGGEQAEPTSPWIAIFIVLILLTGTFMSFIWLRRRFQIVRKNVSEKFGAKDWPGPAMSDETWKKITSGDMAKRLLRKEK